LNYDFPTNLSLPANALLLLVATNPAHFRLKYSVPTEVLILGPYAGQLQNSGENLELQAPDNPNTNGAVPYVAIEAVRYNDQSPWPPAADGGGPSLQRLQASAFGNEPLHWIAAAPSPGRFNVAGDSDGDGLPDAWEQAHGTFVHVPDANDHPHGDGLTNWQEFLAGTHPNDAASHLKVSVQATTNGIELEFLAISNRTYTILQRLVADSGSWTALSNFPAHGTNRLSKASVEPLPGERQFFRLVTPAQPGAVTMQ
jgi:hypothetical protein